MNEAKSRRRFQIILLFLLMVSPWIGVGAFNALQPVANSPLDWVDSNFAPRADFDVFNEQFGSADVVIMSWPECRLDNALIDRLVESLRTRPVFFEEGRWLFDRVVSGRELHQALRRTEMGLGDMEARQRMAGWLLGPDRVTTAVIVAFNQEGLRQRGRLVPLIRAAASTHAGAAYEDQHLAGPIMDGFAVDHASQLTMSRYAPLSSIIVFCVCILCLDSFYTAAVVFAVSCLCQVFALAILHQGGGQMSALLIVLPPLIQVLTIAGGIHLVNYAIDAARESGPETAVSRAIQVGWLPCVLSSATTAIGLGSLTVSGLDAVRDFGLFAALGVVTTLSGLLVLVPGFLVWRPISIQQFKTTNRLDGLWRGLMHFQTRHATRICIVSFLVIVSLGIGLSRLTASVRIETLFGSDSRLLNDYAWLEKHVGPLVPIEVIVTLPHSTTLSGADQIQLLRQLEALLARSPHVEAVTSCLDFLPITPFPLEGGFVDRVIEQSRPQMIDVGYLRVSPDDTKWRLTAHLTALGDLNYGVVLDEMRESLELQLPQATVGSSSKMNVNLSGLMPLVHEIQSQLLNDLFSSFLTAFVLIAVVMTIVQAGFLSGFLSMIPNLFPALALFGFLGWIDHPVDIGSIMTASVAMGIAVDDTLHFLTFFTRQLDAGSTRVQAVQSAYRHCGRAMIQTTLICGAGLAVFALSDFIPTARFAWMMVALLGFALVGDLLILPAILLSPLGQFFETKTTAEP